MKFELPTISLEGKPAEVVVTGGAAAVTFIGLDTALQFTAIDSADVEQKNAEYMRAAYAAVAGYVLWRMAMGKNGYVRNAIVGASVGAFSVAGSRLISGLKWRERIVRFATPVRFRAVADGGQGRTVQPRVETTTSGYRLGAGSPVRVTMVAPMRAAA